MNHGLFWKLFTILVAGMLVLFAGIHWFVNHTEQKMSYIDAAYQQELIEWAARAEQLYQSGEVDALHQWVLALQKQEQTWVAVVTTDLRQIAGDQMDPYYTGGFFLGRSIEWMIHLYMNYNPVMDFIFADKKTHFLIRLPERMRPGGLWQTAQFGLQVALPFCVLAIVCLLLYRHIVSPIRKLEKTTRQFSEGHYQARVSESLGYRKDELASLAKTFDAMAERTGGLIITQRQLLADLSHELRTPITRIEMALDTAEKEQGTAVIARIKREITSIRELSEDALTLAWMETERPAIETEKMDLVDLLDSIIDNARFEFSDRNIQVRLPENALLTASNNRLLGQAIENIVRNALRYTPVGGWVKVSLLKVGDHYQIKVSDQGPGVPEEHLENIFKPFFRVEKARGKDSGGFGLGLALAKRQIEALSGSIKAANLPQGGLQMTITLAA